MTTRTGRLPSHPAIRSHTFTRLSPDTPYTFGVKAVTAAGESNWATIGATTGTATVPPPENLRVSVTATSATMTWDRVAGATGYKVLAAPGGSLLLKPGASNTSHTYTGLSPDTYHTFWVRTVTAAGESNWATIGATTGTATVPPPENLRVSVTATSATMTWDRVAGATGYKVLAAPGGSLLLKPGASNTSHTYTGLSPDTYHTFWVRTVTAAGESDWVWTGATTDPEPVVLDSVSGRVQIHRMSPTPVGEWTIAFAFRPTGGTRIVPELGFTKLELIPTSWYFTSPVEMTIGGQDRVLGRIAFRKTTATGERIEVGFQPSGGSVIRPSTNTINYSDMTVGSWYQSSEFSFTLPDTSSARADSDTGYVGRLANALAPDEEFCATCDAPEVDMVPLPDEPPPKDSQT